MDGVKGLAPVMKLYAGAVSPDRKGGLSDV